jgi:nitrite reductase/ring-hydroxylating ferredoxin subunit
MKTLTVNLAGLEPGEIRPVSDGICIALSAAGVSAFERICPHAGADLANGYVDGEYVRCAWHNTPFRLASGGSPCRALRGLTVYRVRAASHGACEIEVDD